MVLFDLYIRQGRRGKAMYSPRILVICVLVITARCEPVTAADPKPTRDAFLGEVLDAKPTDVTAKFDDYTPGSYHIEKENLLRGLTDEAKKRKLTLRAVLITGPMPADPLWTSYVTVFLREGDQVRVNHLVMPHARITVKSTGLIQAERYEKWIAGALDSGLPQKEPPAEARSEKKDGPLKDFGYHLLLAAWDAEGKTRQVYYGTLLGDEKKLDKFAEQYNGVLKELKQTYPDNKD
jgi:hypothetical protein